MNTNTPTEERQQLEYKVVVITKESKWFVYSLKRNDFESFLNTMGEAGWQLTSFKDQGSTVICAFMRPKSPNPINTTP